MDRKETLDFIYEQVRTAGLAKSQRGFAKLLDVNENALSAAMNGNTKYLTDSLVSKAVKFRDENLSVGDIVPKNGTILVIPSGARGGTLGDFTESVKAYDCERMISPIKGADYALQVTGDSMSPEYPNGSQIIIKKVDERLFIEWGKVYVLDTPNGAVIKQIRKTDTEGIVECVSINPAYQSFTIHTSDIIGWYRVLMVMALK